jgi:gliding motility-associated protein GldE
LDDPPSYILLSIANDGDTLKFILSLSAMILLLIANAFISASETAFFTLKNSDLERLRKSNQADEQRIPELLRKPRQLLATIRIASAFVVITIILSSIAFVLTFSDSIFRTAVILFFFATTFLITYFGDILPKTYSSTNSIKIAKAVSRLWVPLLSFFKPISIVWLRLNGLVERGFDTSYKDTVEELNQALEMTAVNHGSSNEDDKEILRGIVNFGTLTVKRVMRTRSRISAADITLNFHQLMEYVSKSGYSRVPVYKKSLDRIEGILHIKDLLPFMENGATFQWQDLLRPGFFVPATKKLDSLLKDFQEKHVHMAIVVNEYGGTLGLITLEDIIEEIIGDINDEFDEAGLHYQKIDDHTFVFEGKTSLHDFCKLINVEPTSFDSVRGESKSLGGLILELNRELPRTGTQINFQRFTFAIESADRKRIKRVKVIIHDQEKV